jgi:predicted transcriptional regulator
MVNRSRMEIISQILEVANGRSVTKSNIMYKALLSYAQMKEYLRILAKTDLLSYDLDTQMFKTTEKGLRLLDIYNQMDSMIRAAPLEQQHQRLI